MMMMKFANCTINYYVFTEDQYENKFSRYTKNVLDAENILRSAAVVLFHVFLMPLIFLDLLVFTTPFRDVLSNFSHIYDELLFKNFKT